MTVFLVGAGPGDLGLITVRGLELVRRCDALVVDELVAPELVEEAPDDALVVHRAGLTQSAVDELLVELGCAGLEVVRLKGGDPFVFGRGGEEALALTEAGVPFEVVPGVSSFASVPSAFGIPVTHRGVSAQVTLVSGHSAGDEELDFAHLARTPGTLVFFMGLRRAARIADGLIEGGKDPRTPAAVIARGTRADGRAAIGELRGLDRLARGLPQPALIVVGDVVALSALIGSSEPAAVNAA